MHRYAVINNKGGVGKSTISTQIAHGLSKMDKKCLLIDLDDQNDSSMFLGFGEKDFNQYTLCDYFVYDNVSLSDCIINARENLDLLPNTNYNKLNSYINAHYRRHDLALVQELKPIGGILDYDFVIIDCAPTKNAVNDAVITYADKIILPVQVEAASVKGAKNMYEYLDELEQPYDKISLIIPNMYDKRTNESKINLELLRKYFDNEQGIVTTPVHRRVKITEAGKQGKTVFEYDEEAAEQFFAILEEVVVKVV